MTKPWWPVIVFMIISGIQVPGQTETPKRHLDSQDIFFVAPLSRVLPDAPNQAAICLDLDFEKIKYPSGFINTLNEENPPLEENSLQKVEDPERQARIKNLSGVALGETFTIVTDSGRTYPAETEYYGYLQISASTVMVAAMASIKTENAQEQVFIHKPALAVRGMINKVGTGKVGIDPSPRIQEDTKEQIIKLCGKGLPQDHVVTEQKVLAAWLEYSEENVYFVSLWHRPDPEYDIEEHKITGCLYRQEEQRLVEIPLPALIEPKAILDLDGDRLAEIIGIEGNAAQICHVLLSYDGKQLRLVKKGLCIGY